jgi:hypothetical protein
VTKSGQIPQLFIGVFDPEDTLNCGKVNFYKRSGHIVVVDVDDPNRSSVGRLVGDPVLKDACEERVGE